jgi:hypothetical protein
VNNFYEKLIASTENILTRRPAPGLLRLRFGAWRITCDKNKPAASDALKVICAEYFSTPAKFDIMPEISELN